MTMTVFALLLFALLDFCLMAPSGPVWPNREIPGVRVEHEQNVLRQSSDDLEWILLEEPPPDVPVPMVMTSPARDAGSGRGQSGAQVMVHWQVNGQDVSQELTLPIQWPAPVALDDQPLVIDLGTSVAPVLVETRVFLAVDANGLPSPEASAIWCSYLDPTAVCRITRESERDTWRVNLELPAEPGTYYVSMRGEWRIPSESALIGAMEWDMFDAGWIFTVVAG
jgi:hypothetical protein